MIDEHAQLNPTIPDFQFVNRSEYSIASKSDILVGLNNEVLTIACLLDLRCWFSLAA